MNNLDNSPETRRNFIGSSDAPAIMEVSPWDTPFTCWEKKVGLRQSIAPNSAMQLGIDLEEEARQEFERQTGLIVFPARFFHPEHSWMCATLDGIDLERKHMVEIKCPGKEDHECAMDGVIPEKYIPQVMHQMIVLNLSCAFYFSWTPESSKIIEVNLDQYYCNTLLQKEISFWEHVQSLTPPPLTERDYVPRDDQDWHTKAQEWLILDSQLKNLQEKHDQVRKDLIAMSGKSNTVGSGIKMSRILRKGHVEYANIPELINVDLDKYRKQPIESWRIAKC